MNREAMTYRGVVYPWHCDPQRMGAMGFAAKFNEASLQLLALLGLAPEGLQREGRAVVAAEQHLRYLRELQDGDVVTVVTRVLDVSARSLRWRHEMREEASGAVAATCECVGVHLQGTDAAPLPESVAERVGWL